MSVARLTFSAYQILIRDNLFKVEKQYYDASVPVTTGRKVNFLSDDPTNISRIFSLRDQVSVSDQYEKNLIGARLRLGFSDSRLAESSDVLQRVRDVALQANDPTVDSSLLAQMSTQLADLKDELLAAANGKIDSQYVFSGSQTNVQPFSGTPTTFHGNSNARVIQGGSTIQIQTNLDGDRIFTGNIATATGTSLATSLKNSNSVGLGVHVGDVIDFTGSVGGVAMSGQSLTVTTSTTLDDIENALQAALRSVADGDLTETAVIQPDGSIQVTSDGANAITNLQLSISGNTTFNTAFTYSTSIAAGGVTANSDALKTGTGEDLFDIIDDLQTAILAQDTTSIATILDRIDTAESQVNEGRATVGIRQQQIDALERSLGEDRLRILEELSSLQEVNVDEALSTLVTRETALKLVFSTSSRILSVISGLSLQ